MLLRLVLREAHTSRECGQLLHCSNNTTSGSSSKKVSSSTSSKGEDLVKVEKRLK